MRLAGRIALLAPLVLAGLGCRGADVGTGSNTNWVGCQSDEECVERRDGNACVQGLCATEPTRETDAGFDTSLQPASVDAAVDATAEVEPMRVEAGRGEPNADAGVGVGETLLPPAATGASSDAMSMPDPPVVAPTMAESSGMTDSGAALEVPLSPEGQLDWTVEVDVTVATLPWDLAAAPDGDVYLLAHGRGPIDENNTQGRVAPKVIKYDAMGEQLWEQAVVPGIEGEAYSGGLAVSAAGEVYATAVVGGARSDAQSILTKFAVDGRMVFSEELGAQGNESVSALALDAESNVYVVGDGLQDINSAFIEKRSADGVVVWSQVSDSFDGATDVAVDAQGSVYVTGYVLGDYDEALGQAPEDLFLRKYTSAGELLWEQRSGLDGQIGGWSVAVDAAGNVYVVGLREAPSDVPFGAPETLLIKFDADGVSQWNQSWAGLPFEFSTGIAVEPDGVAYVSSNAIAPDGSAYAMLYKYSAEGEQLWARDWGPDAAYDSADVVINSEGYVFVAGSWMVAAAGETPERRGSYLKRFR